MPQPPNAGAGISEPVGDGDDTVQPGDCIFSIAHRAGHFWQTLWNHPRNADLNSKRGSPHVLLPGDKVFVPPIVVKEVNRPTGAKHRFVLKGVPIDFELKILNGGAPRRGLPYIVAIEGRISSGTVPDDGVLKLHIYPSDRMGRLTLRPSDQQEEEYSLDFGHLDPAHVESGAKGRLRNLGLLADDDSMEALAEALSLFQKHSSIPMTGSLDDTTARKLTEVHGS